VGQGDGLSLLPWALKEPALAMSALCQKDKSLEPICRLAKTASGDRPEADSGGGVCLAEIYGITRT
jgi:hypothetical protein